MVFKDSNESYLSLVPKRSTIKVDTHFCYSVERRENKTKRWRGNAIIKNSQVWLRKINEGKGTEVKE